MRLRLIGDGGRSLCGLLPPSPDLPQRFRGKTALRYYF